jgi:hypothetical protein
LTHSGAHQKVASLQTIFDSRNGRVIAAAEEYRVLITTLAMDGDHTRRILDQGDTARFIKAAARNVETTIVIEFETLKRVKREVVRCDRIGNLRGTGFDSATMWGDDHSARRFIAATQLKVHALHFGPRKLFEVGVLVWHEKNEAKKVSNNILQAYSRSWTTHIPDCVQ